DFVVAVTTNSTNGMAMYQALLAEIRQELFAIEPWSSPEPPAERKAIQATPYLGRYTAPHGTIDIEDRDGRLLLSLEPEEELAAWYSMMKLSPPTEVELTPTGHPERF